LKLFGVRVGALRALSAVAVSADRIFARRAACSANMTDPRRNPQGRAANLDLDRRRTRTVLIFRHHWNEIGCYKACVGNCA
jgi:hypothetical protein